MAMARVFGTYELLERILLHLPLRQLLFAQKISKHICDVIRGSDGIQKVLFLRPVAPEVYPSREPREDGRGTITVWRTLGTQKNTRPLVNPWLTKSEHKTRFEISEVPS